MGDILDEASSLVECKECPWYKACAMPMRFGTDDLIARCTRLPPGRTWARPANRNSAIL